MSRLDDPEDIMSLGSYRKKATKLRKLLGLL
jgi:hypothetical protein